MFSFFFSSFLFVIFPLFPLFRFFLFLCFFSFVFFAVFFFLFSDFTISLVRPALCDAWTSRFSIEVSLTIDLERFVFFLGMLYGITFVVFFVFYNSVFQRMAFLSCAYLCVWRTVVWNVFASSNFGLFGRYGIVLVLILMF